MNKKLKTFVASMALACMTIGTAGCDFVSDRNREAKIQKYKRELEDAHDRYAKDGKYNHTKEECVNEKLKKFMDQSDEKFKTVIVPSHIEHATEAINNR